MAQFLIKAGNTSQRLSYQVPNSSLFWDTQELNLYLYRDNKWILLGGASNQGKLTAGDNLEIIFPTEGDTQKRQPTIRVVNNVDVNTVTLKLNEAVDRVSFYKLGEWENQSFLPIFKYNKDHPAFIGGKIFTKTTRQGKITFGEYSTTVQPGLCNISGGDESGVKFSVAEAVIKGIKHYGFKTYDEKTTFVPPEKVEIWFDGWKNIPEEVLPETNYTSEDIDYIKSISEDS